MDLEGAAVTFHRKPLSDIQIAIAKMIGFTDLDIDIVSSAREAYSGDRYTAIWIEHGSVRWFRGQEMREVLIANRWKY